ncbi:MAG: glycosyltransferase [Flavobacteriaceae bacterium]|nr:glycosyltransferase [Flavobacteriaceae bacterium]
MKKILLFSPLCKPKEVLEVTLPSMINQISNDFHFDVLFYNDNNTDEAKDYVDALHDPGKNIFVEKNWIDSTSNYKKHNWTEEKVNRIIFIKNKAINHAIINNYDALFLVDADLVLNPRTLAHLDSLNKDFVFELFWTLFTDADYVKPNCWDVHSWAYTNPNTILQLKKPGTYKVGAGGACTLLSKESLEAGVNFTRISNMGFNGEDRHICTRAECLGFDIFIDSHYPAYHIHDQKNIKEAKFWFKNGSRRDFFDSWLNQDWEEKVNFLFSPKEKYVPKSKLELYRIALYKAKRAFKNYLRYNSI